MEFVKRAMDRSVMEGRGEGRGDLEVKTRKGESKRRDDVINDSSFERRHACRERETGMVTWASKRTEMRGDECACTSHA